MKDNKNVWYASLSAQFQVIEEAMPLSRFAAIEAVLQLLTLISCWPPHKRFLQHD